MGQCQQSAAAASRSRRGTKLNRDWLIQVELRGIFIDAPKWETGRIVMAAAAVLVDDSQRQQLTLTGHTRGCIASVE